MVEYALTVIVNGKRKAKKDICQSMTMMINHTILCSTVIKFNAIRIISATVITNGA